jgi:hypothetical protein
LLKKKTTTGPAPNKEKMEIEEKPLVKNDQDTVAPEDKLSEEVIKPVGKPLKANTELNIYIYLLLLNNEKIIYYFFFTSERINQ